MNTLFRLAVVAITLAASTAFAQITVSEPWVRATVPAQRATGAFMQITSKTAARLVAAKSPVAGVVEVHEMRMDNGVMIMRALAGGLELPPGKAVELKPGGYHVMLMDLKAQVKEGDAVPLTLVIEGSDGKQSAVEVTAPARALSAAAKPEHMHH